VIANRAREEGTDHVTNGVNHEDAVKEEGTCEPRHTAVTCSKRKITYIPVEEPSSV
jgi:hypothetical protein